MAAHPVPPRLAPFRSVRGSDRPDIGRLLRSAPCAAPIRRSRCLAHHDAHQLPRLGDDLAHRLPRESAPAPSRRPGPRLSSAAASASAGTVSLAVHLAVDLHRDLDLVVLQQGRVERRPGLVGQRRRVAEDLPELLGERAGPTARAAA